MGTVGKTAYSINHDSLTWPLHHHHRAQIGNQPKQRNHDELLQFRR